MLEPTRATPSDTGLDADRARWRAALALVAVGCVVRLVLASVVPLFPDETYYWDWSRSLAAGYYDHPPIVALLIRLSTSIVGTSPFGLRFVSVLVGTLAPLTIVALARRHGGGAAAWRASLIILVLPIAAAGLGLATPDTPMLAALAIALWCLDSAVSAAPGSRAGTFWWIATGCALGAAFDSKYTAAFPAVGGGVALIVRRELRAQLKTPGPYLAAIIALALFAPVVAWNAAHGWVSIRYQLEHGLNNGTGGTAIVHELQLVGTQLGLASPVLFVMLIIAVTRALRRPSSPAVAMLATIATVTAGAFVLSALKQEVKSNWPAPAYVPAVVLLALQPMTMRWRTWLSSGCALAGGIVLLLYSLAFYPWLPIRGGADPYARAAGWEIVAHGLAGAAHDRAQGTEGTWMGSDRYEDVSEMEYFLTGRPRIFSVNSVGRGNQYECWPTFPERARGGDTLVLALHDGVQTPRLVDVLRQHFEAVREGERIMRHRGADDIDARRIWIFSGWRQTWPPPDPHAVGCR